MFDANSELGETVSMKKLLFLFVLIPLPSYASFLLQYNLNYSSETDETQGLDYEKVRTFHKVFLGASVNSRKTVFFGWNINSWNSSLTYRTNAEESYSLLEMGPKVQWYFNDEYHWYVDAEWNPYARGERVKDSITRDISGSSFGVGLGYRFKLSRLVGFGASIHYHTLGIDEEKISSTESERNDTISNLMPMLELSLITR